MRLAILTLILLCASTSTAREYFCGVDGCICDGTLALCAKLRLERVPQDLPKNITFLDLSDNALTDLPAQVFANYPSLVILYLQQNALTAVAQGTFANVEHLVEIDMSSNRIASVANGAFTPVSASLEVLNLTSNALVSINDTLAPLLALKVLALADLPQLTHWPNALPPNLHTLQMFNDVALSAWPPLGRLPASLRYLDVTACPLGNLPDYLCDTLSALQTLNITSTSITQLAPMTFAACTNLTTLNAGVNKIPIVPPLFAPNAPLVDLFLADTTTTSIDASTFTPLTKLRRLYLGGNYLSALDPSLFATLTELVELDLSGNDIAEFHPDIFASQSDSLKALDLAYNDLLKLPASLKTLRSLFNLNITGSNLNALDADTFTQMTNLTILGMNVNFLTELAPTIFATNTRLQQLFMSASTLLSLPPTLFEHNHNITVLDLSDLYFMQSFPDSLFLPLASSLRGIQLSSTNLYQIPSSLSACCNLFLIGASNTSISSISPHFFDCMTVLDNLDLSQNPNIALPTQLLVPLVSLTTLSLGNCLLTSLPLLPPSILFLSLQGNAFNAPFPSTLFPLTQLASLDLSISAITSVSASDMTHFPKLFSLILSDNPLGSIGNDTFASTPLISLSLARCSLTFVGTNAFPPTLYNLDLSMNLLTTLPPDIFTHCAHLSDLNLGQNHLSVLSPTTFSSLDKLVFLSLQLNRLPVLPSSLFASLVSLIELDLNGAGPLVTVPATLFANNSNLQTLSLSNMTIEHLPCGLLKNQNQLTLFRIEVNNLQNISECWTSDLKYIDTLSLAGNSLRTIGSVLMGLTNLKLLNVGSNRLTVFPTGLPPNLIYVSFNNNDLSSINFNTLSPLTQLATLDLSNNLFLTEVIQPVVLYFNYIDEINLANNHLTGFLQLPSHTSLNLANNFLSYTTPVSAVISPLELGQIILVNNSFPSFTCPPGSYGDPPSCFGYCDTFCESIVTLDNGGTEVVSSCSGPSPRDCCPFGYSGSSCQYLYVCSASDCCSPGTCQIENTFSPLVVSCVCPAGMHSYRPTNTDVLARTNIPGCFATCPFRTYQAGIQCIDCDSACLHGCTGPSTSDCRNPALLDAVIGGVSGAVLLLIIIAVGTYHYRRSRRRARIAQRKYVELHDNVERYWLVPHADLQFEKKLAHGAFGEVWRADWDGRTVAVKKLRLAVVEGDPSAYSDFEKEISFYKQHLRHRNLCSFFGAGVDPKDRAPFLVLEYMERGSLRSLLDDDEVLLPWDVRLSLATDVARGMRYLHEQTPPILHRDLKASNVFVSFRWIAKIGDLGESRLYKILQGKSSSGLIDDDDDAEFEEDAEFGYVRAPTTSSPSTTHTGTLGDQRTEEEQRATTLTAPLLPPQSTIDATATLIPVTKQHPHHLRRAAPLTNRRGTLGWQAPEVCRLAPYGLPSDVFSYAIVLWEIASRALPYADISESEGWRISEETVQGVRPPIPDGCPPVFARLVVACWHPDPVQRPLFPDVLSSLEQIDQ